MKHIKAMFVAMLCTIVSVSIHTIGFGKYNLYPPDALYEHQSVGPLSEKLRSMSFEFQQSNKDLVQKMRKEENNVLLANPKFKELGLKQSDALRKYRELIKTKEFEAASEKHSDIRYKAFLHPKARKAYEVSQKIEADVKQELKLQEAWQRFERLGKEAANKPSVLKARNRYKALQRKHFGNDENPELMKAYNLHFNLLEKALDEPAIKESRKKWQELSLKALTHPKVKAAREKFDSISRKFPDYVKEDTSKVKAARKVLDDAIKAAKEKVGLPSLRMSLFTLKSSLLQPVYKELRKHASPEIIKLQDQYDSAIDKVLGEK